MEDERLKHIIYCNVAQFSFSSSLDLVKEEMAWMVYQESLDLRFDYFVSICITFLKYGHI